MDFSIFWIVAAVVVVFLDALALASVWRTTKNSSTKIGWTVLIVIAPLIGVGVWGIAGPRGVAIPPTSKNHSKG